MRKLIWFIRPSLGLSINSKIIGLWSIEARIPFVSTVKDWIFNKKGVPRITSLTQTLATANEVWMHFPFLQIWALGKLQLEGILANTRSWVHVIQLLKKKRSGSGLIDKYHHELLKPTRNKNTRTFFNSGIITSVGKNISKYTNNLGKNSMQVISKPQQKCTNEFLPKPSFLSISSIS